MQEEILEPQPSQMIQETQAYQTGETLPEGSEPVSPQQAAEENLQVQEPEAADMVEIDGQKFANEKEALKYLQGQYGQLQTEKMIEEARIQGMQEALSSVPQVNPAPAAQAPVEEDDLEEFYANPAEYLRKRDEKVKQELSQTWEQKQLQAQRDAQVWNDFASSYPDLASFKQDVELVASEHRSTVEMLARRDPKKAMDYVAMKTREKFQKYVDALKPTKTLSNAKTGPSVGSNPGVTPQQNQAKNEEKVDFISQLKKHRR